MTVATARISSGDRVVDADTFQQRARRVAAALVAAGVRQGDCVAILMRNDLAFLEATLGTMLLGAYAVPVNWHFKAEEIAYVIGDSGALVLIAHADLLAERFGGTDPGVPVVAVVTPGEVADAYGIDAERCRPPAGITEYESWLAAHPPYDGPAVPPPQSMLYTSGTTGHPKGVRRTAPQPEQLPAIAAMREQVYGLRPGVRVLVPGPLYHSAPNVFAVSAARLGDLVALMPRFEPEAFLQLIEAHRIEAMFMVPTMFIRLLKLPEAVRRRYDLSSLRHVIHAAAPCPAGVKEAMIDWWGPVIWEFYGGTESGAVTLASSDDARRKPGTVGRVVAGAEIRILGEDGSALPNGAIGEVYSRYPLLPDFTYHNDPDKRRSVERDGFVTCGDLGYLDAEDYLFLCDRKRDMVISGGVNIYPAEIEAVLHGLAGVHDCAVFGIPDPEFGEALMAVVEPLPGAALSPDGVRDALRPHLADYKVPRRVEIRTGLPREDSGKIFKRRLRDPYWEAAGRRI